MTREESELLAAAMRLPPEARAALAGSLLESLDEAVDEDAESAWALEIARRLQQVEDGTVTPVPWAEARRRILAPE